MYASVGVTNDVDTSSMLGEQYGAIHGRLSAGEDFIYTVRALADDRSVISCGI